MQLNKQLPAAAVTGASGPYFVLKLSTKRRAADDEEVSKNAPRDMALGGLTMHSATSDSLVVSSRSHLHRVEPGPP